MKNSKAIINEINQFRLPWRIFFNKLNIKWFGRNGLKASSLKHIELAEQFEEKVVSSSIFEIIFPVTWGLVCFKLENGDNND